MIDRKAYKREAVLRNVERILGKASPQPENEGVDYYFGGGFWRGYWDEHGNMCLVNPDRTSEEIAIVEKAIEILCY